MGVPIDLRGDVCNSCIELHRAVCCCDHLVQPRRLCAAVVCELKSNHTDDDDDDRTLWWKAYRRTVLQMSATGTATDREAIVILSAAVASICSATSAVVNVHVCQLRRR